MGGRVGERTYRNTERWTLVAAISTRLRTTRFSSCSRAYPYTSTMPGWQKEGWAFTTSSKNSTRNLRTEGKGSACVVVGGWVGWSGVGCMSTGPVFLFFLFFLLLHLL